MSRVLLAGESWFSYTVHQKGFDTFTTSEYTEGAGEFLAALRGAGHDVTYVPAHEVHTRRARNLRQVHAAELAGADEAHADGRARVGALLQLAVQAGLHLGLPEALHRRTRSGAGPRRTAKAR